jgi:hypothetical protein
LASNQGVASSNLAGRTNFDGKGEYMNIDSTNIVLNDTQVVLQGLEQAAVIAVVLAVLYIALGKKGLVPAKFKQLLIVVAGVWVLAIALQYTIQVYNYIHYVRPLQQSLRRQNTGL